MRKIFALVLMMLFYLALPSVAFAAENLWSLASRGTLHQIQEAIRNGANVNARDMGLTPLHEAARSSPYPEVIAALIEAGADVNARQPVQDLQPLHLATRWNPNPEITTALIKGGADVNAVSAYGSPLSIALTMRGFGGAPIPLEILTALIKGGADVNAVSYRIGSATPLSEAVGRSNPELVAIILRAAGSDIDMDVMLHIAAHSNPHPEVIKIFIEAGADVNDDTTGQTVLISALNNSNPEVAVTLIEAGADVNARTWTHQGRYIGRTVLMEAARVYNSERMISILLDHGADPNVRTDDGRMAIDLARENEALRNTDALRRLAEASGI